MAQHKWHKEIKAWADGADIEQRSDITDWHPFQGTFVEDYRWQFRIKPQPKEPQYLYVYKGSISGEPIITFGRSDDNLVEQNFVAKIKLDQDDE